VAGAPRVTAAARVAVPGQVAPVSPCQPGAGAPTSPAAAGWLVPQQVSPGQVGPGQGGPGQGGDAWAGPPVEPEPVLTPEELARAAAERAAQAARAEAERVAEAARAEAERLAAEARAEAERAAAAVREAEQIASEFRWRLDASSLREVVDDQETLFGVAERLEEPLTAASDNWSRARLLCLRSEVLRLQGDLDRAGADSRLALAHGQAAGDDHAVALARVELAQVLRLRGEHVEADRLFHEVIGADVADVVRSVAHENAGRSCVDQARYLEACDHLGRAMRLGDPEDLDLVARLELALDEIYIRVLRDGWGPSPRRRTEIMSAGRLPVAP
jgi:tetratricopeptide (TPR) repeat protein